MKYNNLKKENEYTKKLLSLTKKSEYTIKVSSIYRALYMRLQNRKIQITYLKYSKYKKQKKNT